MASLSKRKDGMRSVQFYDGDIRRTIYLPKKTTDKDARGFLLRVERLIVAKTTGQPISPETQEWVAQLPARMHTKLSKAGLVSRRSATVPRLEKFLDDYIASRTDVEPSTLEKYRNTRRNLVGYFTTDPYISEITQAQAEAFVRDLMKSVARTTAGKRIKIAKMMFNWGIKSQWIAHNPLEGIKAPQQVNRTRDHFVTCADADKVIAAAPDDQWRLIIALARYGGLRTPSEQFRLTWDDVLWDEQKLVIHSQKKKKDEHGGVRTIPIYPELKPYLDAVWQTAPTGKHIITRYRDSRANLRTQFERIIKRAGLEPWPKLFQNLRATRQTELQQTFPAHVVAYWMGNTMATADRHYLQVTGQHYADAVKSAAKSAAVLSGTEGTGEEPRAEKPGKKRVSRKKSG